MRSVGRRSVTWMRLVLGALALSSLEPGACARADESEYKPMPWHLVDLWWDFGEERPFESYSLDVTIHGDVPASSNLYIAPIGLGHLSEIAFYGGLQTQADGYPKRDPKLRKIGRGLLMSMWGERSLDAIRPADGGFCQSSGHEGDFVSVRRPYEWKPGTYTYRIVRMDREQVGDRSTRWVGAFVYSHAADENVFIGALRFPQDDLKLSRKLASFVEVYGRRVPVTEIPQVQVTFGNPRINGAPVEPRSVQAVYPKRVPDYAAATWTDGQVLIDVGQPVERPQDRRQAELLPR